MGLKDIFESVTAFFEHQNIEYAVIGGFALYGYGYVRATQDIDFVTRIENQEKIISFFENLGFETVHCSIAFSNHVHPVGNSRVDIMYIEGNTADTIFSAVQKKIIFNQTQYPIVAPVHLIAMKLFAAANDPERKLKDLADIKEIIGHIEIDANKIKNLFEKYGLKDYYDSFIRKR